MKKILFIAFAFLALGLSSCSKDKDDTTATITLVDANGIAVTGVSVYAYTKGTWDLFGDDSFFSDLSTSSDVNGVSVFLIDDITAIFAFDSQETIYFSAHYDVNGTTEMKFTSLTFKEGDQKSATLTID